MARAKAGEPTTAASSQPTDAAAPPATLLLPTSSTKSAPFGRPCCLQRSATSLNRSGQLPHIRRDFPDPLRAGADAPPARARCAPHQGGSRTSPARIGTAPPDHEEVLG